MLTTWVTELMTGASVHQATVSIWNKKNETNQQGLCTIEDDTIDNFVRDEEYEKNKILVVKKDKDVCILADVHTYVSNFDSYTWHVFNDRGLYKPKEEVHVKGYVRLLKIVDEGKLPTYAEGVINYTVCDPRGQELQQSAVVLNNYGAFDIKFTLPDNINLGKIVCSHWLLSLFLLVLIYLNKIVVLLKLHYYLLNHQSLFRRFLFVRVRLFLHVLSIYYISIGSYLPLR